MKIKYLRLSKKERKDVKLKFFNTDTGKYVKSKLTSSPICSLLCILGSIYLILGAFLNNLNTIDKVYGILILIIGIILLIATYRVYIKKINEYVVKKK